MTGLLIALFGIWLTAAGYHGNGQEALKFLGQQRAYVTWLVAVLILWGLYQIQVLRPVIKPFIVLALFALAVKNAGSINAQLRSVAGVK